MRKQIIIALVVGIIISFITGFLIGWSIPSDNMMLTGDRSHLIGSWKGADDHSSFSVQFFENSSLLFSSYKGNFTVNQDRLSMNNQGITMTAEFFFIGDYDTVALTNIRSSSGFSYFSYFGSPYGIILRRV